MKKERKKEKKKVPYSFFFFSFFFYHEAVVMSQRAAAGLCWDLVAAPGAQLKVDSSRLIKINIKTQNNLVKIFSSCFGCFSHSSSSFSSFILEYRRIRPD